MEIIMHFLAALVAATLDVVSLAMMVRVIISLFSGSEDSKISIFLACVTEPFIVPVRFLLFKFNLFQNSPIDWSFTIAYLVIIILRTMLPIV